MDSVAHSRQTNRTSATFSKKISSGNNGGLPGKNLYDDVYGGPPKFGVTSLSPRIEDYSEIFSSFHTARASSIPVLDLPAVDETEVFFDIRSSTFDYAEVFGGFDGTDFAVSYEDLVEPSNGRDVDSSDDAWTPAESESLSEESDRSGNNQSLSNEDPYQLIDGNTEFSVLYHKVNQTSNEDMSHGKTHMTQLHVVPGFTQLYDETTLLHKSDPYLHASDDINLNMDFTSGMVKGNHLKKTMSHLPNHLSDEKTFGNDLKSQKGYSRNSSCCNEAFISVSDISLRTQPSQLAPPSRPPPVLDVKKGYSNMLNNSEQIASKGTPGDDSPPFFDVEIDMSSSAVASAAAMKEAMEKAQEKLKCAKELMEKKKEGFESRSKLGPKNDVRNNEGRVMETVDRSDILKDERAGSTFSGEITKMKTAFADERKNATPMEATPQLLEGERLFNMSRKSAEEKRVKESGSYQGSARSTGDGKWEEATEFFDLIRTENSVKPIEPENNAKILVHNTKFHERGKKGRRESMESFELQEAKNEKVKAVVEDYLPEQYDKKAKAAKETCEQGEDDGRSKVADKACRERELAKKKNLSHVSDRREKEKGVRMSHLHVETGADQSRNLDNMVESRQKDYKQLDSEKLREVKKQSEAEQLLKPKGHEKKLNETNKQMGGISRLTESGTRKDNEKRQRDVFAVGESEVEKRLMDVVEPEENVRFKEALQKEEDEKKQKQACTTGKDGERLRQIQEQKRNEKGRKEALKQENNDKKQKEAHEREEQGKGLKDAFQKEDIRKGLEEALELEENERRLKQHVDLEENEKVLKEALEVDENEERCKVSDHSKGIYNCLNEDLEKKKNSGRLKEAQIEKGNNSLGKQAFSVEGSENTTKEGSCSEHAEKFQAQIEKGNNSLGKQAFSVEGSENTSKEGSCSEHAENFLSDSSGKQKEKGRVLEHIKRDEDWKKLKCDKQTRLHVEGEEIKPPVGTWNAEGNENLQATHSACAHEENKEKLEGAQDSMADKESGKTGTESGARESNLEQVGGKNLPTDRRLKEPGMVPGDVVHEENQFRKQGAKKLLPLDESVDKVGEPSISSGQRVKSNQNAQVSLNQEESKENFVSSHSKVCVENGRQIEAAEPATLEGKGNKSSQRAAPRLNVRQPTERKEKNLNGTLMSEDKETERVRRERELEKVRIRKLEEEWEREREREKDRMAVDRATLEARERAFVEARERTERAALERATAEARQRTLAEARERLEKTCADAREKSDKTTTEARLRAERAAVERATAEARERAVEKAMAERAAYEARERLERSVSDKFTDSSRSGVMRQSYSSTDMQDPQFQGVGSTAGSRYTYSSVHGASSFGERSEGLEVESAQRCRARLERYRRTAERAAKALAERNMRDLLAQKEQAERNRLAETLDAEVRRWSSGKEGNLRALLSTLQYILGPDSGWQPTPLTGVITSAAVKKAYRKATLCVHPDKLQQRGASIQHKYICEKVFDLLKEAWNKFNSEER